jgi:hypothetical protein
LNFSHSGSASGDITLESYDGETAILDGSAGGTYMIQIAANLSHIKIAGLELRNFNCNVGSNSPENDRSAAIVIRDGCSYIDVRNNIIHNTYGTHAQAISARSYTASAPITHLLIDGNKIYNIQEGDGEVVSIGGAVNDWQFSNNEVWDWGGNVALDPQGGYNSGIPVNASPTNGLVSHNYFHDTTSGCVVYIDGGQSTVVDGNTFRNVSIAMATSVEHNTMTACYNTFQNNIVINSKDAFYSNDYPGTSGLVHDNKFLNNTIYGGDSSGSGAIAIGGQYNALLEDNIFANCGGIYLSDCPGTVVDYNLYSNTSASGGAYSINGDPLFVNAAGGDFHLSSGSPAIDAGNNAAGFYAPIDYDGITRPQRARPDIGAFED